MSRFARSLLGGDVTRLYPSGRGVHTYVIGQPGTGKSRALESWAMQDILAGHGVTVVDPHGDLFHHLVGHLARRPEHWNRVVLLDPCDPKWTVSFNPLEAGRGVSQERVALFLTDVIVKIWKLDVANAPRLVWLLTNSFLALSNLRLTLLDLPRFLLDAALRERLLPRLAHAGARAYFSQEFPKTPAAVHQWASPVLNKIAGLIFDADLRLVVAGRPTFRFREVLDRQRVLLVHLPKGILGEGPSALLGAFVVAQLQKAALSRTDSRGREPHYLYLDEFQNYTTDNIQDVLSESRKYGLFLTLAHQYLDQLASALRSGVLNTAGILNCFRVGYGDAYELAKEIFPSPDFRMRRERQLKLRHFGRWPLVHLEQHERPLGWEGLAHLISNLPPRQFWSRRRGTDEPVQLRTLDMRAPILTTELQTQVHKLRDYSGTQFGRLKADVRRELAANPTGPCGGVRAGGNPHDRFDGSDFPFWGG